MASPGECSASVSVDEAVALSDIAELVAGPACCELEGELPSVARWPVLSLEEQRGAAELAPVVMVRFQVLVLGEIWPLPDWWIGTGLQIDGSLVRVYGHRMGVPVRSSDR